MARPGQWSGAGPDGPERHGPEARLGSRTEVPGQEVPGQEVPRRASSQGSTTPSPRTGRCHIGWSP